MNTPLGDARTGKLADNITAFGRALRRAGVPVDSSRIALAQEAAQMVGVERKIDFGSALECVMVGREQDRGVFRELFDAFFRDPEIANKLLAQMLPSHDGKAAPTRRPRVAQALSPGSQAAAAPDRNEQKVELDAAMTASEAMRLRHADFNALSAQEYALVERLAREVPLRVPQVASRRTRAGERGAQPHWARTIRRATRTGGELAVLQRRARRPQELPLLVLVDVSGSMERYARLLLAFLHAATRGARRRDVFAFGTHLTDLTPVFRQADTDAMLLAAAAAIDDFAGGTRLGESLAQLRARHARRLVGGRTLVLLISDGLDTGDGGALAEELGWLKRHCRKLMWLNPLLRYEGYAPLATGAAVLHRFADRMVAVHNLEKLEDLAAQLAAVMKAR
ncbi:VWA domain-containing protein [Ramlibacter solisilvae]|uniref:von Willebrand factor A n=1 Tax=Ramlibacter tataouinensis TaxID=94132 RepID=A0A127JWQ2_9BURK|nr:VWA domain-containing protein [Ramlibacter tataouinensis]AMO24303.1 von Willebrand factor A [Ramlibacter tataouinensis]